MQMELELRLCGGCQTNACQGSYCVLVAELVGFGSTSPIHPVDAATAQAQLQAMSTCCACCWCCVLL
jgi:hypothetical protein